MPDRVEDLIRAAAKTHGVPEALALAVAEQESGFNPTLVNKDSGAIGTFQILPTTGSMLKIDPLDPRQNIDGGVKYLRQLLDRHQGDLSKVLGTYGGVVHDTAYVPGVLARVDKYKGAAATAVGAPGVRASGTTAAAAGLGDVGTGGMPVRARGTATPIEQATQAASRIGPGRGQLADAANTIYQGGKRIAGEVAKTYDPTTGSGRVNLAAGAAAAATTYLTGGLGPLATGGLTAARGALPTIARTILPALGATAGGTAMEAGNQAMRGEAPNVPAALQTGATQGAYEIAGQAAMWPVRKIGSVLLAHPVAKAAMQGLARKEISVREAGIAGVQAVQRAGRARIAALKEAQTLAAAGKKEALDASLGTVKAGAEAAVAAAKSRGTSAVAKALPGTKGLPLADLELDTAADIATATNALKDMQRMVPSVDETARAVRATVVGRPGVLPVGEEAEGAAAAALRQAGERVHAATVLEDAPPISMMGMRDEAARLQATYPPASLFGESADAGAAAGALPSVTPESLAQIQAQYPHITNPAHLAWIAQRQVVQQAVEDGAPAQRVLPGLLGLIQTAPDAISFEDAHIVKTMLDATVNWDVSQKPILKNLTKRLRGSLRNEMAGFAPYDEATRAYQGIVPLYQKGVTRRLIDAVGKNATPDKAERVLNARDPLAAARVKRLLVDMSAEGGDATQGQHAWDMVRSAWTHRRVIQGDPEKLLERVQRLQETPEFAAVVFGDRSGREILGNLSALGQSIAQGNAKAAELRAAAGALGDRGVIETNAILDRALAQIGQMNDREYAAFQAQQARILRGAREANTTATERATQQQRFGQDAMRAEMQEFAGSSLGKAKGASVELHTATDALTTIMRFKTHWGTMAMIRLLMGPKRADLLQYAAYASPRTQAVVQTLMSPMDDRLTADAVRMFAQYAYGQEGSGQDRRRAAVTTPPARAVSSGAVSATPRTPE